MIIVFPSTHENRMLSALTIRPSVIADLIHSARSVSQTLYIGIGRRRNFWCRLLLAPIFFHLLFPSVNAQSLSILDIDPSGFPTIEASVIAIDANDQALTSVDPDDLRVFEDGNKPQVLGASCPVPTDPIPLSVGLVIDRSGSMLSPLPNGDTPLDLIIDGSTEFLRTLLFTPPTAVSITAFNEQPFLISYFRTSAPPLISAMQTLTPEGGTIFDPAFLDPLIGGINLLRTRPDSVQRILIFVTDGEPNSPPNSTSIIAQALDANVEVYTITIGTPMTPELSSIANRTGGSSWGYVSSSQELTAILQSLALISRGVRPCTVSWRSETECGPGPVERHVIITHNSLGVDANSVYSLPEKSLILLESTRKFLWFGQVAFPSTPEQTLTITARNGAVTVTGATFTDSVHFSIFSWGGPPPPFTLNDGESRTISVQFAPTDTTGYAGALHFSGDPCPSRTVLLAGGDKRPHDKRTPLRLTSPVGGKAFGLCDSVAITWGGIPPEEPVRIQYSSDNGINWITITDSAVGYEHRWLPPAPGTMYRIKISTDAVNPHIISTVAGGGPLDEDDIFATQVTLLSPIGLDTRDDTLFIAESGRNRIRAVDLVSGIITTSAGTGVIGNGGDGGPASLARLTGPQDVLVTDDTIYIADFNNHKIRVVDRVNGRIYTYAGTGRIGFSPDGTYMESDTAVMSFPTSIEIDDRYLYVSEAGNHRIRRIDRATKIISTVAGGGTSFDSDGTPATRAKLTRPYGMVLKDSMLFFVERDAGRVRRVNLRNNIITTIAGNGQIGDGGDGDAAVRAKLQLPRDVAFYGDSLFIADALNNKIRMVDMTTGIISTFAGNGTAGYGGDGGPPWNASLNSPSGLVVRGDVLYVSDRLNNRIRAITLYRADGLDSSSSPFSVSAPELLINETIINKQVDLGKVGLGAIKDSIFTALVCNSGNAPLVLDSAKVNGAHASDFQVVGGITPDPIPPGACRTITIEFKPTDLGIRSALLLFYGACALPDTLRLRGEGTPKCGAEAIEIVDFGSSRFNAPAKDSVITASLCNNDRSTLPGELQLISADGAFELIEGGGPYSLREGECLDLTVRYSPTEPGLSMAMLDYGIPITCGRVGTTTLRALALSPARLSAEGVDIPPMICPDNALDTLIELRNQGETSLEISSISFTGNNEGFSLADPPPTPDSPLVIPAGDTVNLPIRFAPSSPGRKLATLQIESNDPRSPTEIALSGKRDSLRLSAISSRLTVRRDKNAIYPRDTIVEIENTGDRTMKVDSGKVRGDDYQFFALPENRFPIEIPAGAKKTILVRILEPTEDREYRATLDLEFSPACDLPQITIDLLHSASSPLLTVLPSTTLTFPPLLCDDPDFIDTTITLRNDGGTSLKISPILIVNNPKNNFEYLDIDSITLAPGSSTTIRVRFKPQSSGEKRATLQLTAKTEDGVEEILEEISLIGKKDVISFSLSETSLTFDPRAPSPNTRSITLTNTGTSPITWSIPSTFGEYTLVSLIPPVTPVNDSSELMLRYDGPTSGLQKKLLTISDSICRKPEKILQLITADVPGGLAAWLPHDSALFNTTVSLPIRYHLKDEIPPDDQDTFTTKIRFVGTTFFFEGISNGQIVDREWDPLKSQLAITIRGSFDQRQGDTLVSLIGRALLASQIETPLVFEAFTWDNRSITTTQKNGNFKVLGTCRDIGLHLVSRVPKLERIRPNPASEYLVAEFVLGEWAWLGADLITPRGEIIKVLPPANVEAGWHELRIDVSELPTGIYTLRIATPHGTAEERLLIVQ